MKAGATPRACERVLSKLLDTATKSQEFGSSLVRRNACTVSFVHVSSIEPFDFLTRKSNPRILDRGIEPEILDRVIEPDNSRQGN